MNLILDIDGTLWNTTGIVAEAWNDIFEKITPGAQVRRPVSASALSHEFGKPTDVIIDDLFPEMSSEKKAAFLELITPHEQEVLRDAADASSIIYPGVRSTLEKLSLRRGCRLFIVSNCQDGYIPLVMNKLDIASLITDFTCYGMTGLQKDQNIRLIMDKYSMSSNDTYYVGDTHGDYMASVSAGVPFIFASYGFGDMEKDHPAHTISSFDELLTL